MASPQKEELGQSDAPLARLGAVGMGPKEKLGLRDRMAFRARGQRGQSSNLDKSREEKTKKLLGERLETTLFLLTPKLRAAGGLVAKAWFCRCLCGVSLQSLHPDSQKSSGQNTLCDIGKVI